MKRRALIIGNPGEKGKEGYCAGVLKDVENYQEFLMSPVGGSWEKSEIAVRLLPSRVEVLAERYLLPSDGYGLIIFSGHGELGRSGSTVLELSKGEEIDSAELRKGAARQTLILDCCRKYSRALLEESVRMMLAKLAGAGPDPKRCRALYNQALEQAPESQIVLYSCGIDEYSYDDSEKGGHYSYALLQAVSRWVAARGTSKMFSVAAAHEAAKPATIKESGGQQHPQEIKLRSGPYFPFAVFA